MQRFARNVLNFFNVDKDEPEDELQSVQVRESALATMCRERDTLAVTTKKNKKKADRLYCCRQRHTIADL